MCVHTKSRSNVNGVFCTVSIPNLYHSLVVNDEHVLSQPDTKSTFLINVGFNNKVHRVAKNQIHSLSVYNTSSQTIVENIWRHQANTFWFNDGAVKHYQGH